MDDNAMRDAEADFVAAKTAYGNEPSDDNRAAYKQAKVAIRAARQQWRTAAGRHQKAPTISIQEG